MGLKGTFTLIEEGWNLFYGNLGKVWKEAQFSFWMGIASTVVLAGVAGFVGIALIINAAANKGFSTGMIVFSIICGIIALAAFAATVLYTLSYTIAYTKALGQLQGGSEINTKDKYTLVLPVLGVSLVAGAATLGGFILLIIPGIIFWTWFGFSGLARIIDEKKGIGALKYSHSLIRGRFWKILGRLLLLNIIVGAISAILALAPQLLVGIIGSLGNDSIKGILALTALLVAIPVGIIFAIIQVLFAIFIVAIMVVFYFNLKETMVSPATAPIAS